MLIPDDIKVHLYCGITDMRKSINELAIIVIEELGLAFDEHQRPAEPSNSRIQ